MQKHLFDSERDNEIRELNKLREDLKNKLYETNKKLAGVIRVRGIALNPIASIDRLDDGIHVVLSLGSGKLIKLGLCFLLTNSGILAIGPGRYKATIA